ncbi:hypothetical protein [Parasitella parasitica]|uniref:Uncharacterized protein n=1 Tax=Parasitella parasitica TaxID=35722 RepID=A0A0B7N5V2_9FUNG|nr:hypothetical protein [Parasitella parasitica]
MATALTRFERDAGISFRDLSSESQAEFNRSHLQIDTTGVLTPTVLYDPTKPRLLNLSNEITVTELITHTDSIPYPRLVNIPRTRVSRFDYTSQMADSSENEQENDAKAIYVSLGNTTLVDNNEIAGKLGMT